MINLRNIFPHAYLVENFEVCSPDYDEDEGGYVLDVDVAYSKDNMKDLFDKYDIVTVGGRDLKKLF